MKDTIATFAVSTGATAITQAAQGINWNTLLAPLVGVICTALYHALMGLIKKKR